jgi:hypothetical protein
VGFGAQQSKARVKISRRTVDDMCYGQQEYLALPDTDFANPVYPRNEPALDYGFNDRRVPPVHTASTRASRAEGGPI